MNQWRHLLLSGEFHEREALLSGLTLEQVTRRPPGASHSIYQELWHAATWQRIVVARDRAAADAVLNGGEKFPGTPPTSEQEWLDLVALFLQSARDAVARAESPEWLALEFDPGVTMAEELQALAVHNAYHFGKIVALRLAMGAWPPPAASVEHA